MADETQNQGNIVGFTKPKKFLFFKKRSKPIYGASQGAQPAGAAQGPQIRPTATSPTPQPQQPQRQPATANQGYPRGPAQQPQAKPSQPVQPQPATMPQPAPAAAKPAEQPEQKKNLTRFQMYLNNVVARQRDLDALLRSQNILGGPAIFVKKMIINAIVVSAVVAFVMIILFNSILTTKNVANPLVISVVIGAVLFVGIYQFTFRQFLRFPYARAKSEGRSAENGILFAARDMIISLRSGIPLFNAMMSVSTGYGSASKEFAKVVSLIQLGTPMADAIDQVSRASTSKTFKRIMLQASVSIKEGADVVQALEEVVEQVMQERIIELRRYGQRLNALSMFYMLFGIIFPSMGIAVLTILTTFISIFTVNTNFLILIIVFIGLLQVIFLNLMKSSRPVFSL